METAEFKCLERLVRIACVIFIFPMLFACGAAIEPDETISISDTNTTGTSSAQGGTTGQSSQGGSSAITGNGDNSVPTADAGSSKSVTVNAYVELDGSKSLDPDGDVITYQWTLASSPSGSTASLDNPYTASPSITPDVAGEYEFRLTVYDGEVASPEVSVYVSAYLGNAPPVANAGSDQNVTPGSAVTLDGTGSSDFNNDTLSYSWAFSSLPSGSGASLNDSSLSSPVFTPDMAGTYVLELVVNDGQDSSVADNVKITVSPLTAALSWTAPTTNADNTPLTDLAGYKISYGTSSGVYTQTKDVANSSATSYTISGLSKTTYYFVIQAYDLSGNESAKSNEISKTF